MKTPISIHVLALLATPAFAQLVPDGGTAIIDGVTNMLPGSLTIGTNVGNTTLILTNAGRVNSNGGTIGSGAGSSSNSVFITGPGSTWNNYSNTIVNLGNSGSGNRLIVTNGGKFVGRIRFGAFATSSNNSMVVTGPGAEVLAIDLDMSLNGARNQLTIENDARVSAGSVRLGGDAGPLSSNNTLRVTGGGLLLITNSLEIGGLTRNNRLIIDNAGKLTNDSCIIGNGGVGPSASNTVTVTGAGSVWHSRTGLAVGSYGSQLIISNSALVRADGGFFVGSNSFGNRVVVTDPGSELNIGGNNGNIPIGVGVSDSANELVVTNGGRVVSSINSRTHIGSVSGSNNLIRVTGPGSVWLSTNGVGGFVGQMIVGDIVPNSVQNCRLIVDDGGQVFIRRLSVSPDQSSNNAVIVSDPGSLVSVSALSVDLGTKAELGISNGATVIAAAGLTVGFNTPLSSQLIVSEANLMVTNAGGNSLFNVNRGTNLFHGGNIVADLLRVTNGGNSVFQFFRGTLKSPNTLINNGSALVVGDGVGAAVFQLPGGTHTFNQGLVISSNAALQGCGTINGGVIVQPGGTVLSDCTNLVFTGTVTNHGTLRALNGSTLRAQGLVVNNGVIDIIEGTTNFTGGFINNGIVLTPSDVRISEVSISGNDVSMKLPSFVGHTFQLQRRDSLAIGSWTDLGATQAGTGGVLTFTHPGSVTNAPERFYRIRLVP